MPNKPLPLAELGVDADCGTKEADATAKARLAKKAAKRAARKAAAEEDPAVPTAEVSPPTAEADASVVAAGGKAARGAKRRAARPSAAAAEEDEDGPPQEVASVRAEAVEETPEADTSRAASKRPREGGAKSGKALKRRKAADSPDVSAAAPADGTEATEAGADAFRKAHEIIVDDGCPEPMETFDAAEAQLGKTLVKALRRCKYEAPTPIQAQAWPIALQGKDMIAVAKTGSGKTCGFLMPALARIAERGPAAVPGKVGFWASEPTRPSVLVLAPTRELAQQIAGEAVKFGPAVKARSVAIYGGVPKGDQVKELRQGADVLIATPGRLLDFARGNKAKDITPAVSVEAVTYLVLDEADRMLDMGFEPDIREIVSQCPKSGKPEEGGGASGAAAGTRRQTLFFTATWPREVQRSAASLTSKAAVQVRIGQGEGGDKLTANAMVKQVVMIMDQDEKPGRLRELIKKELGPGETAMVFSSMKCRCDEVVSDLQRAGLGIWVRAIHSNKEQWVRDEALEKFRSLTAKSKGNERGVLVATDVASRGLDIPGVAMVVVYDFGRALHSAGNGGVESYVHRIGRTGRAGKTGRAFTFFTDQDAGGIELIQLLRGANQEVPKDLEEMANDEKYSRDEKDWRKARHSRGKGGGKGGKGGKGKGGKGGGKGKGKGKGGSGGFFVRDSW